MIASAVMLPGRTRRFRHPVRLSGLLAVWLALVGQIALGALVLPGDSSQAQRTALDVAAIFCKAGGGTGGSDAPPRQHHKADCALCPLGTTLAQPAPILIPAPFLPTPSLGPVLRPTDVPQARAPPSHRFATVFPRGPPSLV